jgi:hypothetical protein
VSESVPAAFIEGGSARFQVRLLDSVGIPVAPNLVRLLLLPPNATESYQHPVSVEGDSVVAVIPLPLPGIWRYRFETTAEPYAVEESYFTVMQRLVPALAPPGGTSSQIQNNWRIGELPTSPVFDATDLIAISRIDGVTETSYKITIAQLRDMAVNLISQAPTGFFFEADGARINRLNDRVFIGDATKNDGSSFGGGGDPDWFSAGTGVSAGVGWAPFAASVALTVPSGRVGIAVASRASDVPVGYGSTQTSIPFVGIAIMDRTGGGPPYWTSYAAYFEARMEPVSTSTGTVIGIEIDAVNFGVSPAGQPTPSRLQTLGGTTALWLASGGDPSSHERAIGPAQLAIGIIPNTETFEAGIVFHAESIEGTDGTTGFGPAIRMATRHMIDWWAPGGEPSYGTSTTFITSTATGAVNSLQFQDGGTLLVTPAGKMAFAVNNVANSVNGVQILPSVAGQPAEIQTFGDDTNVTLKLNPKGTAGVEVYANVLAFMADAGTLMGYVQNSVTDTANLNALVFGDSGPFMFGKGATIVGFGMVAESTRYLQISNAAAGNAPAITALGTGDIDILLDPGGDDGTVQLAVPTATSATSGGASALPGDPAKYLILRDAGGSLVKIPAWNP